MAMRPYSVLSRTKIAVFISLVFLGVNFIQDNSILSKPKSFESLQPSREEWKANDDVLFECRGKERLVEILLKAQGRVTKNECSALPSWEEVAQLYGEEPRIYGMETCQHFQKTLQERNATAKVQVAGLFNTGTNAFAQAIHINIYNQNQSTFRRGQHQYIGKHLSLETKSSYMNGPWESWNASTKLPVVLIRDPYRWINSMCGLPYLAEWKRGAKKRCPNLVPTKQEKSLPEFQNLTSFNITVHFNIDHTEEYDSLTDYWSDWNRQWFEADFPRLIVRFEDTLYHAEKVFEKITECTGQRMSHDFQYVIDSMKASTKASDFTSALIKYGKHEGRLAGWSEEDLDYSTRSLDEELMTYFHYPFAPSLDELRRFQVSQIVSEHAECRDKEAEVQKLLDAGVKMQAITSETCEELSSASKKSDR